ncbi:hypothetical protein Bpfe_015976 [Biomphalaria pfeifferi]|uniref:Uncharacterized protein n=1 Tax=Biomphalaria pfeifferi TaxID=112525 RepID=A0AAD8BHS9_BIOPF|nr:hypothetical protein Bpfe_015976 [Biomphalaria pfeifferi]
MRHKPLRNRANKPEDVCYLMEATRALDQISVCDRNRSMIDGRHVTDLHSIQGNGDLYEVFPLMSYSVIIDVKKHSKKKMSPRHHSFLSFPLCISPFTCRYLFSTPSVSCCRESWAAPDQFDVGIRFVEAFSNLPSLSSKEKILFLNKSLTTVLKFSEPQMDLYSQFPSKQYVYICV